MTDQTILTLIMQNEEKIKKMLIKVNGIALRNKDVRFVLYINDNNSIDTPELLKCF